MHVRGGVQHIWFNRSTLRTDPNEGILKQHTYWTVSDHQTSMVVEVAEGERLMHDDNILLFKLTVSNLPSLPKGKVGIMVTLFFLDSRDFRMQVSLVLARKLRRHTPCAEPLQVTLNTHNGSFQNIRVETSSVTAVGFSGRWRRTDAVILWQTQAYYADDVKRKIYALAWCDMDDLAYAASAVLDLFRILIERGLNILDDEKFEKLNASVLTFSAFVAKVSPENRHSLDVVALQNSSKVFQNAVRKQLFCLMPGLALSHASAFVEVLKDFAELRAHLLLEGQ
ncbi:unnamed protein product [Polarella glacialis]|uniref:Uncharacterized protein n=1 Tax=Polarella glacialis TaxID=89957 RepID=A0A813K8E8_POLGL|nr:unnamed protein product [Polarella glacialis]